MPRLPSSDAPGRAEPSPRRTSAAARGRGRAADVLTLVAARTGVTPRAVAGLALVAALVLLVLAARVLLGRPDAVEVGAVAPAVSTSPSGPGVTARAPSPPSVPALAQPTGAAPPAAVPAGSGLPVTGTVVVVHVVGQVRRPGVVRLAPGARVQQALAAAGGPLPTADLARVNLARPVVDGEQVVVPRPGEPAVGAASPPAAGSPASTPPVVDLNAADLAQLDTLPGVGPVLAQRILTWRAENGRFSSVDELGEVSGIGDAVLARLRPLVRV